MVSTKLKGLTPTLDLSVANANELAQVTPNNTNGGTSTNLAPTLNGSVARAPTGLEGANFVGTQKTTATETAQPQKPTKHVTFNKDGTVTVTTTNALGESSTNTVSKGAYNLSLQAQGTNSKGIGGVFASELIALQEAQRQQEQGILNPQLPPNATSEQLQQVGQAPDSYTDPLANQNAFGETAIAGGAGLAAGVGTGLIAGNTGAGLAAATALGVSTGGVGLVLGAAAGAAVALRKMSKNKKQDVSNANALYKQSKTNLGIIINKANAGQITNSEAIILFNQAKQDMLTAQRYLKLSNQGIDKYLSDGYDDMVKVDTWLAQNMPLAEQDLRLALLQPNPAKYTSYADVLEAVE
jgi:hypothetical protein